MAKHRKNWIRTIRYLLLAFWLISYLLTFRFYQPETVIVRNWNEKTQRMVFRKRTQGLNMQQITALFLVMGAVIFFVGSFYESSIRQSTASHGFRGSHRKIGKSRFFSRPLLCARCASGQIHRSRRRDIEWMLMLVLVRPYRCHSCTTRFYAFVPLVKLRRRVA